MIAWMKAKPESALRDGGAGTASFGLCGKAVNRVRTKSVISPRIRGRALIFAMTYLSELAFALALILCMALVGLLAYVYGGVAPLVAGLVFVVTLADMARQAFGGRRDSVIRGRDVM